MTRHRLLRAGLAAAFVFGLTGTRALAQDSLGTAPPETPSGGDASLVGPAGTWHLLGLPSLVLSARHGQSAIYDPDGRRVVEFGGFRVPVVTGGVLGDLLELRVCGAPGWMPLAAIGTPPGARYGHSAIYDPVRKRMILFGGDHGGGTQTSGEVFALSLTGAATWSPIVPGGPAPAARFGHSAIYDPVRDRMIVFGGYDGAAYLNDVWALSLSGTPAWTLLSPAGTPPAVRDYHSAIYDPVRDRMLVFGGNNGAVYNDVWELSLGASPAWTPLAPAGTPPSARLAQAAVYDPVGDALVIAGGVAPDTLFKNDVWSLRLSGSPAWSQLPVSVTRGHSRGVAYVPDIGRILLHGGVAFQSSAATEQITLAPPPSVKVLNFGPPPPADGHVMVLDTAHRRYLMHGGEYYNSILPGELFEMPLDGPGYWGRPCLAGTTPPGRHGHAALYDPLRDRVWMHGGYNGSYLGDLWQLAPGPPMTWTAITPVGPAPGARDYASLVYDPNRDRLVLFGGNLSGFFMNDVWILDPSTLTWTSVVPLGTAPSKRLAHRAVFDVARDRMLVFGGYDGFERNDLWELRFSPVPQWVQLATGGAPPVGRHSASLMLDTARDRLVLFGGINGTSLGDLWELPLAGSMSWSPLLPPPPNPSARHGQAAVYDPLQDLVLMYGGYQTQVDNDAHDSWVLNFGSSATPALVSLVASEVDPHGVRLTWQSGNPGASGAVMRRQGDTVWQRLGPVTADGTGRFLYEDREVTPGARYRYGLDLGEGPQAQVEIEVPLRPRFWFTGLSPSPSSEGARLVFSLPSASPVRVEAFDVSGRRVASENLGVLPAGAHRVDAGSLSRLAPGVYALRLVGAAGILKAQATIVR